MGKVLIVEDEFGHVEQPDSQKIEAVRRFTFSNENNVRVQVITYGSTITSFFVPDSQGHVDDIALGYDNMEGYLGKENIYLGATLGRVSNRIAGGRFRLNGVDHVLTQNDGRHHLHGGIVGFSKFNWAADIRDNKVIMTHVSPNGCQGYPGTVRATITYELTPDNSFNITYQATTDQPTPINLSNHSYFNLAGHDKGHRELYNHVVTLNADKRTETDDCNVATGVLLDVAGTEYDFLDRKLLGTSLSDVSDIGYDNNYCVKDYLADVVQLVATIEHPKSGRTLTVRSDQPGFQLYTSNKLPDPTNNIYPADKIDRHNEAPNAGPAVRGKGAALYFKHGAFCIETQKYPNAVNHPHFQSVIVNPGDTYRHRVEYKVIVS